MTEEALLLLVGQEASAAMKRHRLSYVEAARIAGISSNTVWRVLNMHDSRFSTLAKLADATDCDIEIKFVPRQRSS